MVILDALFPPAPDQLVSDCRAMGAQGCAGYAWRWGGIGTWTRAHVDALRAAGLLYVPIVVPGDAPGDPGGMLDACAALGGPEPVVMLDTEPSSEPSAEWVAVFTGSAHARGWTVEDYGPRAVIASHPADGEWLADWLRTGVLDPEPQLPPGYRAQQFVNDVTAPSGAQYDASIVDPAIFGGHAVSSWSDPIVCESDTGQDPRGGAIWLVYPQAGVKQWLPDDGASATAQAMFGPIRKVNWGWLTALAEISPWGHAAPLYAPPGPGPAGPVGSHTHPLTGATGEPA